MRALLICLLFATNAAAAPFLVADVPGAADTCIYTDAAGVVSASAVIVDAAIGLPANGNKICKVDLSLAPLGANNVKLRLRAGTGLWGDSPDVPFTFVRPLAVAQPTTPRLTP